MHSKEIDFKKTVCIDIDGTICRHEGWKGEKHFGEIIPGAKEYITRLKHEGWTIIIHTGRNDNKEIEKFLCSNDIPFDLINTSHKQKELNRSGKPLAQVYLDDRAISFKGDWEKAFHEINNFRPWHEDYPLKLDIPLPKILDPFKACDIPAEMYICGGYIRDYLIGGKPGKDIDIFVNCNKEELEDLTQYLLTYGRIEYGPYGSPRYYPFSKSGSHYIDIVPFYNFIVSEKQVTDINDLLHNFDFTANALAIDIRTKSLYNPEEGTKDINNRILRAIRTDFPEKSVSETIDLSTNTVFWFRLLHFQNKLGFTFDSNTEKWILDNRNRLKEIGRFTEYFFKPNISPDVKLKLTSPHVY